MNYIKQCEAHTHKFKPSLLASDCTVLSAMLDAADFENLSVLMAGNTLLMMGIMGRGSPLLHAAEIMSLAGKEQSRGNLSHSFLRKFSTLSTMEFCNKKIES